MHKKSGMSFLGRWHSKKGCTFHLLGASSRIQI
jgi:hypothetical protein